MIGSVMDKLTGGNAPSPVYGTETNSPQAPTHEDESEHTRLYTLKRDDDSVTPRPKFDFDDLKFGSNFNPDE